jgi:hypothetical protein
LQSFVFAGKEVFPARRLETRAADRLPKGEQVRVFLMPWMKAGEF